MTCGQVDDVKTARSDVRGYQSTDFVGLEIRQSAGANSLCFVAVDGGGGDTAMHHLFHQTVSPVSGASKNQHLPPVFFIEQGE